MSNDARIFRARPRERRKVIPRNVPVFWKQEKQNGRIMAQNHTKQNEGDVEQEDFRYALRDWRTLKEHTRSGLRRLAA
jgi:hypothetical protein